MSPSDAAPSTRHTNALALQKSPYLLQHAHNPVNWRPWADDAFSVAVRDNKPIFLSIGYSTCHWCHVMERESFENETVAAFLNQHFVSIKLDREERPDVDRIYMTFVQATTGQGGWPLNVFLTPDRKPFFGGTYFPPDSRYGRPGFMQLLQHLHQLWTSRPGELTESAAGIHSRLQQAAATAMPEEELSPDMLRQAGLALKRAYDPAHGGFSGAPKFPQPSQPQFLLRYARRFRDPEATRMVLHTCERMAAGGIHDQLGGGFARYSVDGEWLVPHFEKMLYDNAQLAQMYLDAWLVSGNPRHADTARDILDYVLRDMTHPDGGFYSAEDADSEGHEGKFYCWTRDEVAELLTPDEFKVAGRFFGITEAGNFVDHSHPTPLPGQNVLSVVDPNLTTADATLLESAKSKMRAAREQRIRPHLDDKVLASWNGLMLGAMARASVVLGNEKYRAAAECNLAFLRKNLWVAPPVADPAPGKTPVGALYHRWRDGERDSVEVLEGYAFLLAGIIDLYEASLEPKHLGFAIALASAMLAKFYDPAQGGFWQSPATATDLIFRVKEDYDGAEPSGNSVATLALLKLGVITGRREFTEAALKTLHASGARLTHMPQAVPCMLMALDFSTSEPLRVVTAGPAGSAKTRALLRVIHSVFQPSMVGMGVEGDVEPFARTLPRNDDPEVYVCTGTACHPPTREPATLAARLADSHP
jgi:hypothetical protein